MLKIFVKQISNRLIRINNMVKKMREDKNTHSKGERVKIPLLPNNEGKGAGRQGHYNWFLNNVDKVEVKFVWPISRPPANGESLKNYFNGGHFFIGHRVTESQSYRHPRVLSIRVGEIFLCLISINSPTRFARSGIKWVGAKPNKYQIVWCWSGLLSTLPIFQNYGIPDARDPGQLGVSPVG